MPCVAHSLLIVAFSLAPPEVAPGADPAAVESFLNLADMVRWMGVATSVLIVAGAWLFIRLLKDIVARASEAYPRYRLTLQKVFTFLQFFVYVLTGLVVFLLSFRIDRNVLAIVGGTLAVAFGFAVKDLVASFIAGMMIMLDRPFQVGDRVKFGDEYGDIIAIGLRSVRMRTLEDNIVTIPNNRFLSDVTSSGNYGALDMQVTMDFFIGVDQDEERASEIVRESAATSQYNYLSKPAVVLVQQVVTEQYVALRLRLKAYVLDTRYEKAFESDVHLRVVRAFRKEEIGPPAILHRHIGLPQLVGAVRS